MLGWWYLEVMDPLTYFTETVVNYTRKGLIAPDFDGMFQPLVFMLAAIKFISSFLFKVPFTLANFSGENVRNNAAPIEI